MNIVNYLIQGVFLPTMVEGVNLDEFVQALRAGNNKEDYGGRFVCMYTSTDNQCLICLYLSMSRLPQGTYILYWKCENFIMHFNGPYKIQTPCSHKTPEQAY